MSLFRLPALALAAVAALTVTAPAQAAPLNFDLSFEVTGVSGPRIDLLGTIVTGTLEIDDADLDLAGDGTIVGSDMSLELDFLGQSFFAFNDIDYPGFPEIDFESFVPVMVDIVFIEGVNGVAFAETDVVGLTSNSSLFESGGVYFGTMDLQSGSVVVPLPAALPLSLAALGGLGALRLRRRKG